MINTKTIGSAAKGMGRLYVVCLITFGALSLLSLAFLLYGIFGGYRQSLFLAGVWWSVWGSILGLAALPFGIFTEMVTGGVKGSIHRYIRWVLSTFLLTGACLSLFSFFVPPEKINPQTLLPLILMIIILSALGHFWIFKVFTRIFVFVVFIIHTPSIFLPLDCGNVLHEKINDVCMSALAPKRVSVTYEDVRSGKIEFFRKDGKSKIWYYRKPDETYDFFNGEGRHPVYEVELTPVTREAIPLIEEQLKKEWQSRQALIEQERVRQEQSRQEQLKQEANRKRAEEERIEMERLKEERLDREEALRKDLLKPGVYLIEKKLGSIGGGLRLFLQRVDILDDRTIRVSFLVENDTETHVWLKIKAPDGYLMMDDRQGNTYNPQKPLEAYYYRDCTYKTFWLTLDFEPLKRNVDALTIRGQIFGQWEGGHEHGFKKFEYTLTTARRL